MPSVSPHGTVPYTMRKQINWSPPKEYASLVDAFDGYAESLWGARQKWVASVVAMELFLALSDEQKMERGRRLLLSRVSDQHRKIAESVGSKKRVKKSSKRRR